jgi:hypothetical protein
MKNDKVITAKGKTILVIVVSDFHSFELKGYTDRFDKAKSGEKRVSSPFTVEILMRGWETPPIGIGK